ncbi:type I-C CRISPR-associated protein Cas8c/Csd1 [Pseudoflavonifractor sp. DSM 107456]|uniref:Type I-C CRISPR-associated protein Cas8c/Csd1 n=1 Tax=Pseudoflavonifractor gallinarum TaxID=2779352 RepID=A0ABR9RFB9_9FIRM|nr:type I-C CRISPR-associated protein Cas8c/Csd1 [Pseudoflavonifractor gallinarum]MBE5057350.1 type I-C CRISPR-associated protein Cas8c/Csd1 [Pseudoflavonifractor gallinarum]
MILQALTEYYRMLADSGKISPPGWSEVKVSFALCIGADGTLEQVVSVQTEQTKGRKTVLAPRPMMLPAPVKRSSGVAANFLCDNSSYLLGVDNKGKPQRTLECFQACKKLHEELLEGVDSPAAQAVLAFFRTWQPEQAASHPALSVCWEELMAGGNLVFRFDGAFVHQNMPVRQAWDDHYQTEEDGPQMVCLVTGNRGAVESVHPSIKNVQGAQSSGAALVSFNAPAFCSYGKEQNYNAPTSKYAAFAYTTALNHLLSDREHVYRMGDTTVVCWAKCGGDVYQNLMGWALFGAEPSYTLTDLQGALNNLCNGMAVDLDETRLDPDMEFYILGLSPNAARLSVRFFLRNSFGAFLRNAQAHQQRLEITKPTYDKFDTLPMWKLLDETVNQNSRDKSPAPNMAGEVLRSVLTNTHYPATLLNGVALRIRAEHRVTRGRAAILKAYYLKNIHPDVPKEVLTVSLNPDSTNVPYNLGRLFSILEAVQSSANPGINTTIKDKYFNSASATPAIVFPILLNLAQKHLKKLDAGLRTYYDKQITALLSKLGEVYPPRLNLPQQGSFQLGYYHQTQSRFEKKEEK